MNLTERPHGSWGGTMKEELQAEMVMDFIREKCYQHTTKDSCRWCPFYHHNNGHCIFGKEESQGSEIANDWEYRI